MVKKVLLFSGLLIIISACVITSPSELFQTTPTICVECVQATICAENQTDDACPTDETIAPWDLTPSATIPPTITEPFTPTTEGNEPTQTETYTPTTVVEKTETPVPTRTLTPVAEALVPEEVSPESAELVSRTPIPELPTPTIYLTQTGEWVYKAQPGSPKYMKNFAHPNLLCSWSGVAGQVFGPEGAPQPDVVVVVSGIAKGKPIEEIGYTGAAPAYGENGYEIEFPTGPVNTTDAMMIQLFDLQGNELSMRYVFDTYIDCKKALVIYNFVLSK